MRAFVAVRPSEAIRNELAEIRIPTDMTVRWVPAGNIHLTVKFLGEINREQTELLKKGLRATAKKHGPVQMKLQGVGKFGDKIIWVGFRGDLQALVADTEACAEAVGVPKETRPFRGHLTIGRAKGRGKIVVPDDLKDKPFGEESIGEITLMETTLAREGAIYEVVETYRLSG